MDVLTFKAPKAKAVGACTSTDLSAMKTKLADANTTFTDVFKAIGPGCQACVFSAQADGFWQPIVWVPDVASGYAMINFGACYVNVPGGSTACGKGVQDDQQCLTTACPSPDCDGTDMGKACLASAGSGACKTYEAEVTTGCGANAKTLDSTCGDLTIAVNFMCGSGSLDGT
jgi:hypothetical protein